MSLYRASPKDGVAWVTGASTGIGRELASNLIAQGYTVAVTARSSEKLQAFAREKVGGPDKVLPYPCDVTDAKAMREVVAAIERDAGPIVLAVFNAGDYFPTHGEALKLDDIVKTMEINFLGEMYGLVPVVERMRERRRGQVVLVGSATSYLGFPSAAAYGASKAALNNFAEALKHDLDKLNIRIQVVNPGFVDTPLTQKNDFSMPALMPLKRAGKRFAEGIKSGGFEVSFPRRLTWAVKLIARLPRSWRYALIHRATGWEKRPLKTPGGSDSRDEAG